MLEFLSFISFEICLDEIACAHEGKEYIAKYMREEGRRKLGHGVFVSIVSFEKACPVRVDCQMQGQKARLQC